MEDPVAQPPRTKVPWTVIALIALWAITELVLFIESRRPEARFPGAEPEGVIFTVADALSFVYQFLIIALFGHGLVRRLRFVWILAFLWQGLRASFGIVNIVVNQSEGNGFSAYFLANGLYGIVLPIAVAVISFVLLLLPATRRWIRDS